jgi:protein-S-isoprenylcysteine O-methyltransferase Ste14
MVLIALSAFTGVYWPDAVAGTLTVVGIVIGTVGLLLLIAAMVSMGRNLSPFPRPVARGNLVEHGIYRLVRHPIYGAVLLVALGWSLAESPLGLIPTAVLAFVFDLKARLEEGWLLERYPSYGEYRTRTRSRFVPGLY